MTRMFCVSETFPTVFRIKYCDHFEKCYTMVKQPTTLSNDKRWGVPVENRSLASREPLYLKCPLNVESPYMTGRVEHNDSTCGGHYVEAACPVNPSTVLSTQRRMHCVNYYCRSQEIRWLAREISLMSWGCHRENAPTPPLNPGIEDGFLLGNAEGIITCKCL